MKADDMIEALLSNTDINIWYELLSLHPCFAFDNNRMWLISCEIQPKCSLLNWITAECNDCNVFIASLVFFNSRSVFPSGPLSFMRSKKRSEAHQISSRSQHYLFTIAVLPKIFPLVICSTFNKQLKQLNVMAVCTLMQHCRIWNLPTHHAGLSLQIINYTHTQTYMSCVQPVNRIL